MSGRLFLKDEMHAQDVLRLAEAALELAHRHSDRLTRYDEGVERGIYQLAVVTARLRLSALLPALHGERERDMLDVQVRMVRLHERLQLVS